MSGPRLQRRPVSHRERPFAQRRRVAGLDLLGASIRLRCSRDYLRQLELGRAPLSLALAARMASTYGCTLDQLFSADEWSDQGVGGGAEVERPLLPVEVCRPKPRATRKGGQR